MSFEPNQDEQIIRQGTATLYRGLNSAPNVDYNLFLTDERLVFYVAGSLFGIGERLESCPLEMIESVDPYKRLFLLDTGIELKLEGDRTVRFVPDTLRDEWIVAIRREAGISGMPASPRSIPVRNLIFISYRREESADVTGRIYDRLVEAFGPNAIFKDVDSIPLGDDFPRHIDQSVGACSVFLVVMGKKWSKSKDSAGLLRLADPKDFVRLEVEAALRRGIKVIPLFVQNAIMPKKKTIPVTLQELCDKNGMPIRPDPDFHHDMDQLILKLEEVLS